MGPNHLILKSSVLRIPLDFQMQVFPDTSLRITVLAARWVCKGNPGRRKALAFFCSGMKTLDIFCTLIKKARHLLHQHDIFSAKDQRPEGGKQHSVLAVAWSNNFMWPWFKAISGGGGGVLLSQAGWQAGCCSGLRSCLSPPGNPLHHSCGLER